ncbi:MAG: P1 family peptidase [Acetobacteraceae bacterium]|nr:P1 family peptidase [Acetobacteraceae bacterium]
MRILPLLPLLAGLLCVSAAQADQDQLVVNTAIDGPVLKFDWPALQIGIGSYEEGPTGLTIFRFRDRATAVVDVRGGAPGTVNTDLLRLGYPSRFVDAIVFSGGSAYGEEAITAAMTGLKDDGERSGAWTNIGLAAGAIIYDFQGHRLNEIYPDKRLAQAALHDLRAGVFPLQAQGAGRMAMQGGFFGCAAHSGQGGAFRQFGDTKVAAFVVINALGAVTDRDGRMVKCHRNPAWGDLTRTSDLLGRAIEQAVSPPAVGPSANTTISLVVTNRRMSPADLQRLAVEVHTSMARAIQPFSTYQDGDTLYAVSTQEVGEPTTRPSLMALDVAAAETMWDAILASVPDEPDASLPPEATVPPERLVGLAGQYRFGPHATLEVWVQDGKLMLRLSGERFFDLLPEPVVLHPTSATAFYVESRYHTRLAFTVDAGGHATGATVNPGRWAEYGKRLP